MAVCVAVRCLVEHFFPDELRSAIDLMVYHCSGGAPLHDGDAHEVPEEIMSVLDESTQQSLLVGFIISWVHY